MIPAKVFILFTLMIPKNFLFPQMGAAGTPYARSVKPQTIQKAALPDPGVLFDSVMTRKEFEPHPNGVSSMLFYLASIIIHGMPCATCETILCLMLTYSRSIPYRSQRLQHLTDFVLFGSCTPLRK